MKSATEILLALWRLACCVGVEAEGLAPVGFCIGVYGSQR